MRLGLDRRRYHDRRTRQQGIVAPGPLATRGDDRLQLVHLRAAERRLKLRHPQVVARKHEVGPAGARVLPVIAERAGEPVGYALFWPTYDTETAGRGGWLSDLYVAPEARGSGVAMRLMADIAGRTAAAGGSYLVWLVHESNRAARAFYSRFAEEWHDGLVCVCAGERFAALADSTTSPSRLPP